ncbi:MAG: glycosyltransferase [Candidatus Marinimicrobia bacterium]|jgi:glycosyltransferase involved in cell wall biosynthesis|nr:glycosyltransferase [Candidatus Neomarinimicrobiota bacterium]MBT3618422.1 glycosyltransferase [Candidatus Neomarinimicrobiota bacterium]MBT3829709.1 glycosyltransferase [Candidatus Neomarinimicrobiota bacterium]MBT3997070.1 glycosyltransferase [Candidatus Neomarinimicrobiota bacterium]MBT4280670.1 glycosyltransferase [Candidatus Neomarinimicrobiota bacterium]
MENPVISIITPAFNRAEEVDYLIRSIQDQTLDHSQFEHIISDDGSTDNTEDVVRKWREKVDYPIHFISQENQGPGAARNHGLKQSSGDLILFIDSDCEADPKWVEKIYTEFTQNPFGACGGPDASKADFSVVQKAIDFAMTSFFTTGGMRGHSEKMLAKFFPRTHNMGMTREVYEKVGGFGPLRHGQDIEMSNRIRRSGAEIRFIKDAVVYHRRRTGIRQFFKQVFNWGVARVNLYKIDKQLLEPIHLLPSVALTAGLSIIAGFVIGVPYFSFLFLSILGALGSLSILGGIKRSSIGVMIILPIIIPIQIGGYGLGFIWAFINRVILGRGSMTGFVKQYYK